MCDVESNICGIFARALLQCSQKSSPSSDFTCNLAPYKGMHTDRYKNSTTLRKDVPSWCWPNDCSRSGALKCTACYEDGICKLNLETLRELQSRVSESGWQFHTQLTEALPRHSSCLFFRESSKFFQNLSGSNRALTQKNMCMHGADCPRWLMLLGQRGARMPVIMPPHGNLLVEPSQHVASPKEKLRKNVPIQDIWNQSRRYFLLKFTMCREIVHLMWVLWAIPEVTQTLVLSLF